MGIGCEEKNIECNESVKTNEITARQESSGKQGIKNKDDRTSRSKR